MVKKSPRVAKTSDDQSASLTIKKVVDEDVGEYTVKVKNPSGEAEANLTLVIMSKLTKLFFCVCFDNAFNFSFTEKPSAPGAPEPLEVTNDSLTLFWKAPEDDGNSPIIEYIIEYQERIEKTWTQIKQISDTSYKITKLKTNSEYIFRTIAVNEVGESPPSPTSPYIKITTPLSKEAPVIQEPLTDVFVGYKQKVTLSCIVGGVPTPEITWKKNNATFASQTMVYENRVAKYTIEETTETSEATYTCIANNEIGTAETSCKVVIQDKPTISIDDSLLSQRLRTSAQWKIDAKISGFPKPDVTWYKNGEKITTTNKYSITYEESTSIITINSLERSDTGKYVVEAKNNAGVASVELNLNVLG